MKTYGQISSLLSCLKTQSKWGVLIDNSFSICTSSSYLTHLLKCLSISYALVSVSSPSWHSVSLVCYTWKVTLHRPVLNKSEVFLPLTVCLFIFFIWVTDGVFISFFVDFWKCLLLFLLHIAIQVFRKSLNSATNIQPKCNSPRQVTTSVNFTEKLIALLVLQSFWFKLRSKSPCCLSNIHFDIEIPEDDNIQVTFFPSVQELYILCGRYWRSLWW